MPRTNSETIGMEPVAAVRFVTTASETTPTLDALKRRDDIDVTVSRPDGVRTDGGTAAVDCIVVDAETVSPNYPTARDAGTGTPVIKCADDPPEEANDGWVAVGSIAGRRTLVDRVRQSASPLDPVLADADAKLVEPTPVPAYVLDVRGRFVAVNEAFLDLTEYEERALVGSHATLVLTETAEAEFRDGEQTAVRVSTEAGGAVECRRDAGVAFVSTGAGSVTRTVGTVTPSGDQPHIERNPLVLKRAIDAAHTPLALSDPERESNPLVYVNDAFERVTGYTQQDVLGRNCRFLQGEETDPETVATLRAAIDAEKPVTVELENYRADGSIFWNRLTVTPIYDDAGELVHYLGSQEDVTDHRRATATLERQRDTLALLNEVVRHDIRNDLQKIISYLGFVAEETDGEVRACTRRARRTARDGAELTKSARNLSEVLLDEERETTPISLGETVTDEVAKARSSTDEATVSVPGDVPDVDVFADELFASAVRNLLQNAIRHNDKETPEITVSVTEHAETVEIRVSDNGPGIADDRKDEIFGEGVQGLESEGTGIGLYLVETLVDHSGGDVWIEDNDPNGAVFVVELPIAE